MSVSFSQSSSPTSRTAEGASFCISLQTRRDAIDTQLRGARPVPRLGPAVIETRLAEWRRWLRQSTTQSRAVLQRVLRGRIVFTPCGDGYTFEASNRFDKLFSGIVAPRPAFIEQGNRGAEHLARRTRSTPTMGGYSRRFTVNGLRPQRDSNPCFGLERATSWASGRWGHARVREARRLQ
jgi:hypothetical protein